MTNEMKRELKFRVWDGEQMITESNIREYDAYDLLTLEGGYVSHLRLADEYFDYEKANAERPVVMQFTGLKGKDGVEIYEGDILRSDATGIVPIVGLAPWAAGFGYVRPGTANDWYVLSDWHTDEYEVIGNIYENPELIKKASSA